MAPVRLAWLKSAKSKVLGTDDGMASLEDERVERIETQGTYSDLRPQKMVIS